MVPALLKVLFTKKVFITPWICKNHYQGNLTNNLILKTIYLGYSYKIVICSYIVIYGEYNKTTLIN